MLKQLVDNQNSEVESLAAELTSVAYPVFLKGGLSSSWVELELGLWKGLARTLSKWLRELPPSHATEDVASWKKNLLSGLVNGALFVAQEQGIQEPLSYVEFGLQEAFSSALRRSRSVSAHRPVYGAYP